ncbi:MAG: DegT/DnrJ/EryC1/StrS family aminotransferase [Euryarchaeota archaeon]|nr:DegT/DnrJ/EryC1/StrS family aminotransferase [Euryarchaeota archaeon]
MIPVAKPVIGEEEKRAVLEVLESGMLAQGPKVEEFERAFAGYIGVEHAVATSSGTTALHVALLACGIESGDEVITTPFTFIASANAILYCNARPVFADIDERTFNIDPEEVKERITRRTKAVLVVHLYGQPCDMRAIAEICEDYRLKLIEDACQAHGAEYRGRKVGSFGDAACFSFYPTKNMTTGEGGMLTTNSREVAERARLIREHGSRVRYEHIALGYNYRMTDIAAAIGLVQLSRLEEMNARRRANAAKLSRELRGVEGITPPYVAPYAKHVFHQYTVRAENRAEVIRRLEAAGVGYGIHYPKPVHRQELYRRLGYRESLPKAEEASREVLSLPVHPALGDGDIERIASAVRGE